MKIAGYNKFENTDLEPLSVRLLGIAAYNDVQTTDLAALSNEFWESPDTINVKTRNIHHFHYFS